MNKVIKNYSIFLEFSKYLFLTIIFVAFIDSSYLLLGVV